MTYATHDEMGRPGTANLVKPLYHVAWLASRLGLSVSKPLTALGAGPAARPVQPVGAAAKRTGATAVAGRGYAATLSHGHGHGDVAVVMRPIVSPMPSGTTLRVELLAERRGSELRIDVTAEADGVGVRAWQDGVLLLDREFSAPRRTETELLAEAIESAGRDRVSDGAIRMAAQIATPRHHDAG